MTSAIAAAKDVLVNEGSTESDYTTGYNTLMDAYKAAVGGGHEIVGNLDYTTAYLTEMTDKVTLAPGQSWHYKFVNHNSNGTDNSKNYIVPVYDSEENKKVVIRADFWDDIKWANTGFTLTSDEGKNVWDKFISNMNGAIVDMTLSYSLENVFTMSSVINTSDGDTWRYSYNSSTAGVTFTGDIKVALSVSLSWLEVLESNPTAVSATLPSSGYGSLALSYGLDFSSVEGLTAFVVSEITKTAVRLTSVDELPANSGVILKGTPGATYSIPVKADASYNGTNKLHAAVTAYNCTANEVYILQGGLFHLVTAASTVPAGKAYLLAEDVPNEARSLIISDEVDPTGINVIEAAKAENGALKDGKYLIGGKVIIVKNGVKYSANGQILK